MKKQVKRVEVWNSLSQTGGWEAQKGEPKNKAGGLGVVLPQDHDCRCHQAALCPLQRG